MQIVQMPERRHCQINRDADFWRDRRGAAMIEFAILSIPFFLVLFAIFQIGFVFFEQEVFQTAVSDASRQIYTGQVSSAKSTQAQFKQQVCNELPGLIPCSNVTIDVRQYSSFSAAGPYKPVDAQGNYDPTKASYDVGSSKSIVVVTGFIMQPVLFPMMSPFFSNAGSGNILIRASSAFRNEPWQQ